MLTRLGLFTVRRRVVILVTTVLALAVAGAAGGGVIEKLSSGGFNDPNAESSRADALLESGFGSGNPNVVLLVTARDGSVDDKAVATRGIALTRELGGEPDVEQAASYWTLGQAPPLRSTDGSQALVLARIAGTDDEVRDRIEELSPEYARSDSNVTVAVGGAAEVFRQISTQVEEDLRRAETITFPIVLVLLVLVFGSVVAAGLPLGIGIVAILGTLLVLRVLAALTDVSLFALNLTTAMGIGLGIDYALFIVSRFREEMRAGRSSEAAVVRAVETAGRTVLFSALAVAISLAALLVFPMFFLRSFAYAGIAVVALAAGAAVVSLPALLAVLGPRVDKWVLWRHAPKEVGEGVWHRIATLVMRRPWQVALSVGALLLLLGAPFLGVRFGLPDDRALPSDASSHVVQDQIRANFSSQEAAPISVVAPQVDLTGAAREAAIDGYATTLSRLESVARVDALTGSYVGGDRILPPGAVSERFAATDGTWLAVIPTVEPISAEAEALVKDVRAAPAPFNVLVNGPSAELVDSKESIFNRVPIAAAIIGAVTFLTLFWMTGSVLVPVKAIVLNLLSLTATFGAMVWIFQEGNLADLLGFTATGTLDVATPILMFCIAFGLSMDYEVFLLSRIKEEYDRTGDNVGSVAVGLERTGRIVTAAAALLAVVFAAFATSEISFIKLFGVGLTLAVVMDATLIRGALVPAFMRLAGRANWWAPRPLRRLHDRFGLSESERVIDLDGAPEVAASSVGAGR
ncbi:MAG: MMPL family transporter [Actinomycetota bacterium]